MISKKVFRLSLSLKKLNNGKKRNKTTGITDAGQRGPASIA